MLGLHAIGDNLYRYLVGQTCDEYYKVFDQDVICIAGHRNSDGGKRDAAAWQSVADTRGKTVQANVYCDAYDLNGGNSWTFPAEGGGSVTVCLLREDGNSALVLGSLAMTTGRESDRLIVENTLTNVEYLGDGGIFELQTSGGHDWELIKQKYFPTLSS